MGWHSQSTGSTSDMTLLLRNVVHFPPPPPMPSSILSELQTQPSGDEEEWLVSWHTSYVSPMLFLPCIISPNIRSMRWNQIVGRWESVLLFSTSGLFGRWPQEALVGRWGSDTRRRTEARQGSIKIMVGESGLSPVRDLWATVLIIILPKRGKIE